MDEHDYPDMEKGRAMLPNVDPALMQESMERQLKFNPYYYRIMTPEEIEQAEKEQELLEAQGLQDPDEEEKKSDGDTDELEKAG